VIKSKVKIVIVFLSMCLISCIKTVTFPNEPFIEYLSFESLSDSGKLTFSFTDGDGDIGLDQNFFLPPYNTGSFYYYNLYINYYELMDGQWVRGRADPNGENFFGDSITYPFRIENITPNGQNLAIQGDIEIVLEPFYFNFNSNHADSIRFSILLIDRSLNHSNVIFSPTIVP
jgi:hypothetical protein